MIKKEILSLCLCTGFIMSSNTCYVNNSSNETFGKSSSVYTGSGNKEFTNYLTKIKSLERIEKQINYQVIERKA